MDIQRILQGVARITGLNPNRLSEATRQASQYRGVQTKEDALSTLRNIGIDNTFLNRVQGILNSPIAKTVGSFIGMNPKDASNAIDQLKSSSPTPNYNGSDRLSKYKHDLDRVKKYK